MQYKTVYKQYSTYCTLQIEKSLPVVNSQKKLFVAIFTSHLFKPLVNKNNCKSSQIVTKKRVLYLYVWLSWLLTNMTK